jgi:hypothetical protein
MPMFRNLPYCHLVFTLPHALNGLAQFHARWVYRTLMQCAAATLTEFAASLDEATPDEHYFATLPAQALAA